MAAGATTAAGTGAVATIKGAASSLLSKGLRPGLFLFGGATLLYGWGLTYVSRLTALDIAWNQQVNAIEQQQLHRLAARNAALVSRLKAMMAREKVLASHVTAESNQLRQDDQKIAAVRQQIQTLVAQADALRGLPAPAPLTGTAGSGLVASTVTIPTMPTIPPTVHSTTTASGHP